MAGSSRGLGRRAFSAWKHWFESGTRYWCGRDRNVHLFTWECTRNPVRAPTDNIPFERLRMERDPHESWLYWRLFPRGGQWILQSNRAHGRVPWRDYPHQFDFGVTPERCILWLALFSNPYTEDSDVGSKKATAKG